MARFRRRRNRETGISPIPEAISGNTWKVTKSDQPHVDLVERILSAPTDDSPASAFMRAHEMIHVKITPPASPELLSLRHEASIMALQSVEDMRVHLFMDNRKIPKGNLKPRDLQRILADIAEAPPNTRTLAYLLNASYSLPDYPKIREAIYNTYDSDVPEGDYGIRAIQIHDAVVEKFRQHACRKDSMVMCQEGFEKVTVQAARYMDKLLSYSPEQAVDVMSYVNSQITDNGRWGVLEDPIVRLKGEIPHSSMRIKRHIWRDEGVAPAAVYRVTVDGRIFKHKKKYNGGTVLIDLSGSMHIAQKDLAEIVKAAPAATVAVYAGRGVGGRLVIVAENGRVAKVEDIHTAMLYEGSSMTGNIVDGPSLEWLAKQQEPRIWISDGVVTGVGDKLFFNLAVEANEIVERANIERISDWHEVLDALR